MRHHTGGIEPFMRIDSHRTRMTPPWADALMAISIALLWLALLLAVDTVQ